MLLDGGLLNVNGSFQRFLKCTPTDNLYGKLSLLFRTLDQDLDKDERPAAKPGDFPGSTRRHATS